MSDIYEPWSPGIGDRVRLHLSRECPWVLFHAHDLDDSEPLTVVDSITHDGLSARRQTHAHRFEVADRNGETMIVAASELEPAP